jgi:hypothetical protein
MKLELADAQSAYNWLIDTKWIVFNASDDNFISFLENNCFAPGTPKNAEFEVAVIPVEVNGVRKISFWIRFLDTPTNRQAFVDAMELYYHKPLPNDWEKQLERMRQKLKTNLNVNSKIISCNRS